MGPTFQCQYTLIGPKTIKIVVKITKTCCMLLHDFAASSQKQDGGAESCGEFYPQLRNQLIFFHNFP